MEAVVRLPALPVPRPRHRVQRLTSWHRPRRLSTARSGRSSRSWRAGASPSPPTPPGGCASSARTPSSSSSTTTAFDAVPAGRSPTHGSTCSAAASATSRRRAASSALATGAGRRAAAPPERWGIDGLRRLMDRVAGRTATRSGRTRCTSPTAWPGTSASSATTGSAGTPGFTNPASCRRPPGRPPRRAHLPAPLRLAGRRPPNVLVLDTGLRTFDAHAEHPWLRDHCVVHQPWRDLRDGRALGRRGRARRRPTAAGSTSRPATARSSAAIIRQLCPDARDPPPRRADELRRRRRRVGDRGHRAGRCGRRRRRHRHRRDGVRDVRHRRPAAADGRARSAGCCATASSSPRPATTARPARTSRPRSPA